MVSADGEENLFTCQNSSKGKHEYGYDKNT